jgi:hypothetical protein
MVRAGILLMCLAGAACARDVGPGRPPPDEPPTPGAPDVDAISGADPVSEPPGGARPAPSTPEAVVVARLVDREGPLPHCGVLWVVEAMEYEIVRVEEGRVPARAITVATSCPEMPPGGHIRAFATGTTYRLRLSRDYPDRLRSPSIDRADYWCESVEAL